MSDIQNTSEFESQLDRLKIITLTDGEVWSARDLMPFAGYERWDKFSNAINRAIASVNASGLTASDHFRGVAKMVEIGSGARREIEDVELTRHACFILFQNADGSKPEVAAAQAYFAIQTRRQELAAPVAMSDDEIIVRALTIASGRVKALEAKVADDAPKVAYVDEFVSSRDLRLLRNVAKCLGLKEIELREDLLARKWIYCESVFRWSNTQQQEVEVHRYSAYADKSRYFYPQPSHNAPRFKGEVMHTLKVTPRGAVALAKLYGMDPEVMDDSGPDLVAV